MRNVYIHIHSSQNQKTLDVQDDRADYSGVRALTRFIDDLVKFCTATGDKIWRLISRFHI
jgi:hypothetical protein